jgi:type II secretory pathway component PulJ
MKNRIHHKRRDQDGVALLITLILMGVLLGVGSALLNITLKQKQLSGVSYASEAAFQAANAGMECAVRQDLVNESYYLNQDVSDRARVSVECMGQTNPDLFIAQGDAQVKFQPGNASAEEQLFQYEWGSPAVCTQISVYKYYHATQPVPLRVYGTIMRQNDCPAGIVCTIIQARGYNVGCSSISTARTVVEREYTQIY